VQNEPNIVSNYENYLHLMNLREDLENYIRTKSPSLITAICDKLMQSEEVVNGKKRINSHVISAVVLFIANQAANKPSSDLSRKESMELFKQIVQKVNNETRCCLLNSIVNELRYPNTHEFFFSCIVLYLFLESTKESVQELIAK